MSVLWFLPGDDLALAWLERHDDVLGWLHANNINSDRVCAAAPVTVEMIDGQHLIRVLEFAYDQHGHMTVDPQTQQPRRVERLVPLLTELPTTWPAGWRMAGSLPAATAKPRRFHLARDHDVTGVSGEGIVADGVQFDQPFSIALPDGSTVDLPAGWCVIRWRGEHPSIVLWQRLGSAQHVHGHGGATRFVWLD